MPAISAEALFCEDIRQEASGMVTIVGILSDVLEVPTVPGMMPKLAVYARVHLPVGTAPAPAQIWLNGPGFGRVLAGEFDQEMVTKAINDAVSAGLPMAGLYSSAIWSPFQLFEAGVISVEMDFGGNTYYLGNLKVQIAPETDHLMQFPAVGHTQELTDQPSP